MQTAITRSALDVTGVLEQFHKLQEKQKEEVEVLNRVMTESKAAETDKEPGRGEKLDTRG